MFGSKAPAKPPRPSVSAALQSAPPVSVVEERLLSLYMMPDDPLADDPHIGRQVRPPTADDPDMGTIVRVVLKKVQGKKKRVRVYTIDWRNPQGGVEFTREYERFEFMPFLVPEA